jgi:hypothetical protein
VPKGWYSLSARIAPPRAGVSGKWLRARLDAGFLVGAEQVLVLAKRFSFPGPLAKVRDAPGLRAKCRSRPKIHDRYCQSLKASSASQFRAGPVASRSRRAAYKPEPLPRPRPGRRTCAAGRAAGGRPVRPGPLAVQAPPLAGLRRSRNHTVPQINDTRAHNRWPQSGLLLRFPSFMSAPNPVGTECALG